MIGTVCVLMRSTNSFHNRLMLHHEVQSQEVINTETRLTFQFLVIFFCGIQILICFFTNRLGNIFSFFRQKSIITAEVTEQTTEAVDWKLISFTLRGRIHWSFSHGISMIHDDVIKWKHFPRNWPFVRKIHRSPVNFPHKGQWRGALMFSLIYVWINDWANNREAGDLRRQHGHYDVIVMMLFYADVITSPCPILGAGLGKRPHYPRSI